MSERRRNAPTERLTRRRDDPGTGKIRVVQQLDRYQAWPAGAPPEGGKSRTVQIWAAYEWASHRLVAQAATHTGDHEGWLFPPDRQVERWAGRVNRLIDQDAVALFNDDADKQGEVRDSKKWGWTCRWLRHAHASYKPGLEGAPVGGHDSRGSASPATAHDVAWSRMSTG